METLVSAISPGTEMLVYRGEVPAGMVLDSTIGALAHPFAFPLKYGYAAIGRVVEAGMEVSPDWQDKLVLSFHPHESHFVASPDELVMVPPGPSAEEAAFLPNVETAVTFLMDGRPIIGEQVAVFGQGVVGLLTTALLGCLPLSDLVTLDDHPIRRELSVRLGADQALDPAAPGALDRLHSSFDLTYEVSGNPAALDDAIAVTGYSGRVVVGSWYGTRQATLNLGGSFHRSRIRIASSQVSTIDPSRAGRWNKARRLALSWDMLAQVQPTSLITHRLPVERAAQAYELLDRHPEEAVQVILTYQD